MHSTPRGRKWNFTIHLALYHAVEWVDLGWVTGKRGVVTMEAPDIGISLVIFRYLTAPIYFITFLLFPSFLGKVFITLY